MADTRIALTVEDWVRREWMPARFGQRFSRERVQLSSGGVFDFDAVSADNKIVANISTSGLKTASGKLGVGKMQKVRSDVYFLLLAEAERRLVLLTERDMYEQWMKEMEIGRVPQGVEFAHVEIPSELDSKLKDSRSKASQEVSPK